jgi:hypothetical protein
MKHLHLSALVVIVVFFTSTRADDPGLKATILYVQKLQTSKGGFLPRAAKKGEKLEPSLRATSAGVRTLHYLGGELPNKESCIKFVESCYVPESGGFADAPKGKTGVFTTAVGMMAVIELKMPVEKYAPGVAKYLSENAKGFEEIRIAAAGLENVAEKPARRQAWLEEVQKMQNADGTFGKDLGQPRATGGAVVAMLRLGGKVAEPEPILKALKAGQRRNGGFGKDDSDTVSDLETSYRIMRCFHMLKARPADVEGLRSFIAKCRNDDGGYSATVGGPSSLGGTYYAAIIKHWLDAK